MQFFIKRGAIIFTCLFAGLLITQTILIFTDYSSVNNHLATADTRQSGAKRSIRSFNVPRS